MGDYNHYLDEGATLHPSVLVVVVVGMREQEEANPGADGVVNVGIREQGKRKVNHGVDSAVDVEGGPPHLTSPAGEEICKFCCGTAVRRCKAVD